MYKKYKNKMSSELKLTQNPIIMNEEEEGNRLISLFNELIESEECSRLKFKCLIEPVTKIIQNETALEKMRKINTAEFDSYYIQHFIKKQNTFRQAIDPYESMCAALVMQRWH
jgi:hypothetical protein